LANTSHPQRPDLLRTARTVLVVGLLGTLLAACATGNSESADQAATRAAQQSTNVVGGIEQTQIATQFFGPTRVPTAYPTQIPTLANLRLTTNLGDQNAPQQVLASYDSSMGTLIADAQIANLNPGQTVLAVWMKGSDVAFISQVEVQNERELVWIPLRWDGSGSASSGEYTVHIQVQGPGTNDDGTPAPDIVTELGSLVFNIT